MPRNSITFLDKTYRTQGEFEIFVKNLIYNDIGVCNDIDELKNMIGNQELVSKALNALANQDMKAFKEAVKGIVKNILNKTVDKDELLDKILFEIRYQLLLIKQKKFKEIKQMYEEVLYRKEMPSMFIDDNDNTFLGKIIGVGDNGKLQIELENESVQEFALKEIKFT